MADKPKEVPTIVDEQMVGPKVTDAIDISNLPKSDHNWIQRGAKVSCEGANHSHHSHFLVRR